MVWAHQREHYRILYPAALRPRLVVQGVSFEILDLSERGIRFDLGDAVPPEPGNEFVGEVQFRRGETVAVRGAILRVVDREAAARLDPGIPLRIVLEEQRGVLERKRPRP
jgi:hypothetical protein